MSASRLLLIAVIWVTSFIIIEHSLAEERSSPQPNSLLNPIPLDGPVQFHPVPSLQFGGFGPNKDQLGGAETIEVDSEGNIYVVDDRQGLIKVWTQDGKLIEQIKPEDVVGKKSKALGKVLALATGSSFQSKDNSQLYILDEDKNRFPKHRIVSRGSRKSQKWKQLYHVHFFAKPRDMTVDVWGRIIVSQTKGTIEVLAPDGTHRDSKFGNRGVLKLSTVAGVKVGALKAVDTDLRGNIYVTDKDNGRVLRVDSTGRIILVIGSQGSLSHQIGKEAEGIAIDWRGNIFVRDEEKNRFVVFNSRGEYLNSFGEIGFKAHQQAQADEFVIDKLRNRFIIADHRNYRISIHSLSRNEKLNFVEATNLFPTGIIVNPLWVVGGEKGSKPGTQFDEPNELAFDKNGNLWAGDVKNFRVQIYDPDGKFVRTLGSEGKEDHQFERPTLGKYGAEAIRANSKNEVYVVDRGGKKILVYDGNKFEHLRSIRSDHFVDPTGLVIDSKDQFFVACQGTNKIHQYCSNGNYLRTFQSELEGESILRKTETLALDEKRDHLFASSEDESCVKVFQLSSGKYLGESVGSLQKRGFPQPGRFIDDVEGVAIDTQRDWLLLSDEDNGRFMIHDLSHKGLFNEAQNFGFLGAFGQTGSQPGEFVSADGVTVDSKRGLVAIADQGNYRIQVFKIEDIKKSLTKKIKAVTTNP